jgi:hypothetical protein
MMILSPGYEYRNIKPGRIKQYTKLKYMSADNPYISDPWKDIHKGKIE